MAVPSTPSLASFSASSWLPCVFVIGALMVELTLEVQPNHGSPFQVKRKFSAGRLGRIEQGHRFDVVYDPANPRRVELP